MESQELLAGMLDIAIISIDQDQRISIFSRGAQEIFGYSVDEVMGEHMDILLPARFSGIHHAHVSGFAASSAETRRMDDRAGMALIGLRKDGSEFPFEASIYKPPHNNDGNIIIYLRDVTRAKEDERALRESEERLRGIYESANDAIIIFDPIQNRIVETNPRASELLGYTQEELEGMPVATIHPNEMDHISELWKNILGGQTHRTDEMCCTTKLDKRVPVDISFSLLQIKEHRYILAILRDITDRKQTEETLRLTQFTVDNSDDAAFRFGPEGNFLYVNDAACRSLGCSREELLRKGMGDIVVEFSKEDWPNRWLEMKEHGSLTFEASQITKDGTIFPVEITTNYLEFDGKEYNFAFARDITERKRLEEQLLQSQKMEVVGQLAGGMAHDFNNYLTPMLVYAHLAADSLHDEDKVRGYLEEIRKAAERAADLTHQLLAFSRRQVIEPKVVDLNELIVNLSKMIRRLIGENIELAVLPELDLMHVRVDPGQMDQVLINLAVNARDAMKQGGTLTIQTANLYIDADAAVPQVDLPSGQYVVLSVSDNGIGMTEEVSSQIFEPFFTTKRAGEGTGLGLSTCHGIIKQCGGTILVSSQPEQGTELKIYLPAVPEAEVELPGFDMIDALPARGVETILLVEDEPSVRRVSAIVLRRQGYTVLEAANGEEALRMAQEVSCIDLVVTDMVMPLMSGKELAENILRLCPETRILYTSGYAIDMNAIEEIQELGENFVQKPFTPSYLARKVSEALVR
ncbi:MAG: PAS domain S-box protein [Chloroflexi bacterium]|nr:PAS domain S-box protein [Chloroflexota bacterium]